MYSKKYYNRVMYKYKSSGMFFKERIIIPYI
ncbi:hypothetical protein BXY64_3968 [Marinifilum flexuosum]|uniref:Uncharacterized protein n=1 Tax=Marinifilum flexuosum TaxID=1117708 RepID=A0A419WNN6_9BACT|nr:hypothetical protein BXY64_3968 [Marinifilum flexuosum]